MHQPPAITASPYYVNLIVLLLSLLGVVYSNSSYAAQCRLVINEFMPAKQRIIADEEGDYEDWIELYNCSDEAIDLARWYLSDRYEQPRQWQFPDITLPAKGFLIVWASGKDRVSAEALHTNFRINAQGESLLLSDADGVLIDEIPPVAVTAHEVVGRYPDGVGALAILEQASPNAPNAQALAPALIEPPQFSHESGFYEEAFELELSHPDERVTIYYTLDGSEPDPENLTGSTYRYKNSYQQPLMGQRKPIQPSKEFAENTYITHLYETPITIVDRSYESDRLARISTTIEEQPDYFPEPEFSDHWMNQTIHKTNEAIAQVNRGVGNLNRLFNRLVRSAKRWRTGEEHPVGKTQFVMNVPELPYWEYTGRHLEKGTPVRAMAVYETPDRATRSAITTHTYFIGDSAQYELPIIAITAPEQALFGYDEGVLVAGKTYDDWLQSGEAIADIGTPSYPANWRAKQPARGQFQIINHRRSSPLFDVGISAHGNAARTFKTKSLRLYPQQAITYPLFDDSADTGFMRINLRIDRDTRLHDDISHNILHGLAFATQRSQPHIVFINGEYFAVLGAKDRRDTTFLQYQYDLPNKNELELLSFDYANELEHQGPTRTAKEGDFAAWDELLEQLEQQPNMPLEQITEVIDLQSFIDYHAAEIYLVNTDWPSNNNSFWRFTGAYDKAIPTTDGRWRWFLYDLDRAFRRPNSNMLSYLYEDEPKKDKDQSHANKLFKLLMERPEIKEAFVTRFADLINSTFDSERVSSFITDMKTQMQNEMPRHIARWGAPISMARWEGHLDNMVDFAQQRPAAQRQHLQEFFDLGDPYELTIEVVTENADGTYTPVEKGAIIRLNTLTLGVSDEELPTPVAASSRATQMEKYLALPWSGQYFSEMPIQLSVTPREGYEFSRWEVSGDVLEEPQLQLVPTTDALKVRAVLSPLTTN